MSSADLLEEMKKREDLFVNVADIAPIIESNPHDIRGQAKDRPELLGFPVIVIGTRVKVPRIPFIEFCERLPPVVKVVRDE